MKTLGALENLKGSNLISSDLEALLQAPLEEWIKETPHCKPIRNDESLKKGVGNLTTEDRMAKDFIVKSISQQ